MPITHIFFFRFQQYWFPDLTSGVYFFLYVNLCKCVCWQNIYQINFSYKSWQKSRLTLAMSPAICSIVCSIPLVIDFVVLLYIAYVSNISCCYHCFMQQLVIVCYLVVMSGSFHRLQPVSLNIVPDLKPRIYSYPSLH